jgi:hypothetical protein
MKQAKNWMTFVWILFLIVGIVSGVFVMSGCKTNDQDELALQLVVKAATARLLYEHPEWKDQTISITKNAIAVIDNDPNATIQIITTFVISKINENKLLPEEQALVSVFVDMVSSSIQEYLNSKGIVDNAQQMQIVRKVLVWINETAVLQSSGK